MRRTLVALAALALTQAGCLRLQPRIPLGDILPGGGDGRWEYRHEVHCAEPGEAAERVARKQTEMLNRLGKDRWELVEVQARAAASPGGEDCWILTLKRRAD